MTHIIINTPGDLLLLLLLLTRTPVREVCINHEVVMFQLRTGISTDLVSVAIINLLLVYLVPHVSKVFWIFFTSPWDSLLPPHHLSPLYHSPLLSFAPVSPYHLAWGRSVRPPGHFPHPPASNARTCTYLPCHPRPAAQVPPGTWSPASHACGCRVPRPFTQPFSSLGLRPGPCQPLGGLHSEGTLHHLPLPPSRSLPPL